MKHKNIIRGVAICMVALVIFLLVVLLTSCGTREDKPVYLRRFELVQKDECGVIFVYVVRDSKTGREYAVFRAGHGMDVVEVTP